MFQKQALAAAYEQEIEELKAEFVALSTDPTKVIEAEEVESMIRETEKDLANLQARRLFTSTCKMHGCKAEITEVVFANPNDPFGGGESYTADYCPKHEAEVEDYFA